MCVDGLEWSLKTVRHSTRPTFLPSKMNRKQYDAPEMNIVKFHTADIITTSTGEFDGDWVTFGVRTPEDKIVY